MAATYLPCAMIPRVSYPILVCLVGLGLALLVCTVIIGQRTYNLLKPLVSGADRVAAVAAVGNSPSPEPRVTINSQVIAPAIANNPSAEAQPPDNPKIARQRGIEQRELPAQVYRRNKEYRFIYRSSRFQPYPGPALW
jgi:hypothetical protein